jgi:hypothetical protein
MKQFISICCLLFSLSSFGQKYGHVWEFGNQAGINFNYCEPVPILEGMNAGFEGCASICDSTGQLLFYTNSDVVWNRANLQMPNGTLINSGGSLSQVIIFEQPGSDSLYYVVTTRIQAQGTLSLRYHIIDMSLNGGYGDVISTNNVLTLNCTEQVAATYQSNGTDIWLMAHEYGTNNFLAYSVTASGINGTPVISSIGPAHLPCNSNMNSRGEIKFSPDASKVAFSGNGVGLVDSSNVLALFDFDNVTGIVSNPLNLPYGRGDFGLSFSPDNSKLYGTTWKAFSFSVNDYNTIYQFDLTSGNPAMIISSKQIIDSVPATSTSFGSIKIGPDGKIYVAQNGSTYLGVINSPNLAGAACNYVRNGFYLGGKVCQFGLNNYIEYTEYCIGTNTAENVEETHNIKVTPNPFNETTTLYFDNPFRKNCTIKIYDLNGKLVQTQTGITTESVIVEREDLNSGMYFFKIEMENGPAGSGKFIVE